MREVIQQVANQTGELPDTDSMQEAVQAIQDDPQRPNEQINILIAAGMDFLFRFLNERFNKPKEAPRKRAPKKAAKKAASKK